jgi:hypothetical protein
MLMGILRINIGVKKFFHSLPIQGSYIKYLISLVVSSQKCCSIFKTSILRTRLTTSMEIILHRGMFIGAFLLATSCACQGFHSNSTHVVGQLELSYQKTCYSWSQEFVKYVNLERKKESITNKQSEN